ncbi:hypothetical protein [Sphingomonas sp.]|uniref:hypothetical protein n=1 Tax=Sphingomonas sp. TaxID=28214 RepID=UPI003B3BC059
MMDGPAGLRAGRVLLLAPPGSFSAAYIKRSLQFYGVPVFTPTGDPIAAFAELDAEEWKTITACVVVDLGRALFADVTPQQPNVPFLFVGLEPGYWFPGPYSWLAPPFASHQVVDALTTMMATIGSTVNAMMDLAVQPPAKPSATKRNA